MDALEATTAAKPLTLVGTFAALSILYFVGNIVYKLYFSPLSKVPGPKLNAISRIPYVRHLLAGTTVDNVVELHKKYGDAVRVTPNEVSFISGETAFPEIYGFRTGKMKGHENMQKDHVWYAPPMNGKPSILLANDEAHSRGRRTLAHAFSEKALSEQEVLIQGYVDQLVDRLKEVTFKSQQPVDMTQWYNWTTFDVIADLLFGEPFGCLQNLKTHKYIHLLFQSVEAFNMYYIMNYFPWVKYLGTLVVNKNMIQSRKEYNAWVSQQIQKRMERDTERPDFMTHILKHNTNEGKEPVLSLKEIESNAALFITAGSETTATMLSSTTYMLLKNPSVMQKLKDEIRGKWRTYSDITLEEVNRAPYLLAVLSEGLRYLPPVPTGFERRVGKGGEVVSGYFLPENTSVCVSHYPSYHSESNFKDADSFIPERWMGDPKYADDKRSWCQPFSYGPRNCLGKNLAYAEMRLIMAKMIWSFDLELQPESADWMERCKVKTLWVKPPLKVRVKEVVRS